MSYMNECEAEINKREDEITEVEKLHSQVGQLITESINNAKQFQIRKQHLETSELPKMVLGVAMQEVSPESKTKLRAEIDRLSREIEECKMIETAGNKRILEYQRQVVLLRRQIKHVNRYAERKAELAENSERTFVELDRLMELAQQVGLEEDCQVFIESLGKVAA